MKPKTALLFFLIAALLTAFSACAKPKPQPQTTEAALSVFDPAYKPDDTTVYDPVNELVSEGPATETTEATESDTTEATESETQGTEATTVFTPDEDESQESEPATVVEIEESAGKEPAGAASEKAKSIARLAQDLIGSEFEMGASGPTSFDNSGFVYYCCRENGVNVPRRTGEIAETGETVAIDALQPGDIVIFSLEIGGEPGFAGIYIGDGNFVSCNTTESPTGVHSLLRGHWADRFLCGRRIA